jgi:hypothetical protein
MGPVKQVRQMLAALKGVFACASHIEKQNLLLGKLLAQEIGDTKRDSLMSYEFRIFSQWGDDGMIQHLINAIDIPNPTFIEFGVGDYLESNTRFLLMNNNWTGLIMDSSGKHINFIKNSSLYWKYDLTARTAFIQADNINPLIETAGLKGEIGLLHVDIDGNDYWVWKAMDVVTPVIAIIEYNSIFGRERPITIPYEKSFQRNKAHSSNLYYGASLMALNHLAIQKGYTFVGCNSAGNNAYFVRNDKLNHNIKALSIEQGYILSKFRESRDRYGNLTYLQGRDRLAAIKGMPVFNVDTGQMEKL